ncbi:MAG: class I SAM-dependent methyltransferase [Flavitalea sp.]
MIDNWTERWNERYSKKEYAYGEEPNSYLKTQLEKFSAGKILFPAEGEGRNAVFAARLGWTVSAFDISSEGRKKAVQLAEKNKVTIEYNVGSLESMKYEDGQFDAIALIFAHFPAAIKSGYHKTLNRYLRKGGIIIFEAFSKKHVEYQVKNERAGGPKDLASLFSIEEILSDFPDYEILELAELEVELNEGPLHSGLGSVIRFTGRKKLSLDFMEV